MKANVKQTVQSNITCFCLCQQHHKQLRKHTAWNTCRRAFKYTHKHIWRSVITGAPLKYLSALLNVTLVLCVQMFERKCAFCSDLFALYFHSYLLRTLKGSVRCFI